MLQKLQRKFQVFIAQIPLLTAKSETDFQNFIRVIDMLARKEHTPACSLDLDQDTLRIGVMQSTQKYTKINT